MGKLCRYRDLCSRYEATRISPKAKNNINPTQPNLNVHTSKIGMPFEFKRIPYRGKWYHYSGNECGYFIINIFVKTVFRYFCTFRKEKLLPWAPFMNELKIWKINEFSGATIRYLHIILKIFSRRNSSTIAISAIRWVLTGVRLHLTRNILHTLRG